MTLNILDYEAETDDYGIRMVSNIPQVCPPFEEHAARVNAGYTIPQWRELHWMDRAIEIAQWRIDKKIEAIVMEAAKDKK